MQEIKNIINECVSIYNYSVNQVILFGSRAKGTYSEDSDYDILVVINENIKDEEKIKISCNITRNLADNWINADIIVKTKKELKKYNNCIGSIVNIALREGVLV